MAAGLESVVARLQSSLHLHGGGVTCWQVTATPVSDGNPRPWTFDVAEDRGVRLMCATSSPLLFF